MGRTKRITLAAAFLIALGLAVGADERSLPSHKRRVFYVDDDGAQCPGALSTIQSAVDAADVGALILVCPGTYRETVRVLGASKNDLTLLANGDEGQVTIQGDHVSWREGMLLEDVSGVRVSGFTFRDHGVPRIPKQYGSGEGIRLNRAHYCTIDHNYLTNSNMMGITAGNSSHNLFEHNVAVDNDPMMGGCGFHIGGPASAQNVIRHNSASGNASSGIMLFNVGRGNVVEHNNVSNNGRSGIFIGNSMGTIVRKNHANNMSGPMDPLDVPPDIFQKQVGSGIFVSNSSDLEISDNHAKDNVASDIEWDGAGSVVWDGNHCGSSHPAGLCDSDGDDHDKEE